MTAVTSQADGTLLGFDFGTRRIGIAVGNRLLGSARPLTTLDISRGPVFDAIAKLIQEWQPEALVVGIPLTLEGDSQPATEGARRFARQLKSRFSLPVHDADERMSSMEAHALLRDQRASGARKQRLRDDDIDSTAAKLILEHWLSEQRR